MSQKPRTAKPPLSLWLIDNRKRLGWKTADVAARAGVTDDTVRGWEAGRGMGEDARLALESAFGVAAPAATQPGADLAAAIEALAAELRAWRTEDRVRIAELEATVKKLVAEDLDAPGSGVGAATRVLPATTG